MKRCLVYFWAIALVLCACTNEPEGPTWQEQYDLGLRYLSEGNYEEAIIAFTAAIEIDPKQAPAYVGRGDAYIGLGETEENLTAAKTDYEKAIELDEILPDAYLGLADVYIRQGDYDKALEILQLGLEKFDDQRLRERLSKLSRQVEEGQLPENMSDIVTVIGYILYNPDIYRESWQPHIEQYQTEEENVRCAIRTYGIRFESAVDAQFDSGLYSIQEAGAGNVGKLFDQSTELHNYDTDTNGPMIGQRMEMTGYFYIREEFGELIGPEYREDEQITYYTYHPNGEYDFYIQSYTLLN